MNDQYKEPLLFEEFPPVTGDEWHQVIINDLKGADFDKKLIWKTYEGLSVLPYYRQEDLKELPHLHSFPGEPPYVRGNNPISNQWIIRQDIRHSDPVKANFFAAKAAASGVNALGFDASLISTEEDLGNLLQGINLYNVQVHFYKAISYSDLLETFLHYLEHTNIDKARVNGSFGYNPLNNLIVSATFEKPWAESIAEIGEFLSKVNRELPGFKAITINADLFHNAGSSLVQELGYGLSVAQEYLAGLTDAGIAVDEIVPALMFTFAVGSDYFLEIAKIRAARYLWTKIVEQYHPSDSNSLKMYVHSSTSIWNKTLFDPYVNLLRTTTEAMSAAIAGSEMISVEPFDYTFKEADEFSLRIARNQQIILQHESYLGKIVDPAAGSYYIEKLTDEIARLSWDIFKNTEAAGGFISCFKENIIQQDIERISTQKKVDITTRKTTVLGLNQYPNLQEQMLEKAEFLPGGTSEIQQEIQRIRPSRGAEALEIIRLATEEHGKKTGLQPQVFLFSMGNLAMRKARATFSSNFFGCAGYGIIDNSGFSSVAEGVEACLKVKPDITVICSSDEEYPDLVPLICQQLKNGGYQGTLVLAGYPKDILDQMKSAGISEFIHVRTNLLDALQHFHQLLGISIATTKH
ncbi:MAG: methylmalonyl-CoA mutase family protein [Bacteroidales bacterium]